MIYFLLLTAFTVSIDSFLCGLSLSMSGGKKLPILLGIVCTVFIMCLITNYGAFLLAETVTERTASIGGGIILIGIGVYNLLKKNKVESEQKSNLKLSIITGFAVGLDGALANLSLSLMGINAFYVPIIIALMHVLLIYFGILLTKTKFAKKISGTTVIPPLILISLGLYKIIGIIL